LNFSKDYSMTIAGRAASASEFLQVINPATEEVIAEVPDISREQLDQAVQSAREAFGPWRAQPLEVRQGLVKQIADKIAEHAEEFAQLLTREQGKPLADARFEMSACIHWLTEVAKQAPTVELVSETADRRIETHHVPIGVVGGIAPWNFPMTLSVWKIAPALVAGNTLVLKPSPFTPLTSLKLGELLRDVLPPGVLNIVTGGDRLGPWITEHPGIDKVAFTGSTATGKAIMRSASLNLKRITLELGGNDPAIVLPDVDIEKVVPQLFWAAFRNNAQFCLASKRMYVHESIYERFKEAFVAYAKTVKVGDGTLEGTQIGPIQNKPQFESVKALLSEAKSQGVSFILGGDVPETKGYFVPIAIADNPPEDSRVVAEEAFGPVLPLLRYYSTEEAIQRANASIYGLGASVWGKDLEKAQEVADQLEAGTVWINTIHELGPNFAFGGHKQSGLGVENGLAGLLEYTNPKTIVRNKIPL
jgi:acyl-CoA reductase-like NAD-dependent aldehyde dehydrogenase